MLGQDFVINVVLVNSCPTFGNCLPNIFAKNNKIEKLPSFSDLYLGNTTTGMFQLKTTMFRQNIFVALFTTKRSSF